MEKYMHWEIALCIWFNKQSTQILYTCVDMFVQVSEFSALWNLQVAMTTICIMGKEMLYNILNFSFQISKIKNLSFIDLIYCKHSIITVMFINSIIFTVTMEIKKKLRLLSNPTIWSKLTFVHAFNITICFNIFVYIIF